MASFTKTTLDVVSAVLILLGIYATAGLVYALWVHSDASATFWAIVAVVAFVASIGYQAYVNRKRRLTR